MDRRLFRVLVVEDDEEDYLLTRRLLKDNPRASFDVTWARTVETAHTKLTPACDVCLVDYRLGPESGLELIEKAIADGFRGPMILLTGRGDLAVDVEAMRAGCADYLEKDQITPELMDRVIRHAIERKAVAELLRRSEQQLRQSQKLEAIGSLAGGIAHDLNNVLSVILSYSELLSGELKTDDPMRADLQEIHAAGMRAAALTRQLLAFSRQQVLKPSVVDLRTIVEGMRTMLGRLLGEDVELTTVHAPALRRTLVDPGQMEQVIMNLAVNARDAMPKGGRLTIETANAVLGDVEAREHVGLRAGPHVTLTVSDTGLGMDATTQARAFEPFFTTKEVGKGTGLGLSTVFGIVQQSGGAISAHSESGKGTVFRVYFPATDAALRASAPPSVPPPDGGGLRGSETVLVVEDEEGVRAIVCTILRRYGYDVLEAQSGGDALVVCEQHPATISLLLTDVIMPRMSGPELAARLAPSRPGMRVLFMSGYTGGLLQQHGAGVLGADFLQKPITPETLARQVRATLGSASGPGTA